jgi:hypothetical protein
MMITRKQHKKEGGRGQKGRNWPLPGEEGESSLAKGFFKKIFFSTHSFLSKKKQFNPRNSLMRARRHLKN